MSETAAWVRMLASNPSSMIATTIILALLALLVATESDSSHDDVEL
jgi:hypothetical protein